MTRKAARGFFVKALRLSNESAQAYNNLGRAGRTTGTRHRRGALPPRAEGEPGLPRGALQPGQTYIAQKKPEEAERHLRQLLAVDAYNADAQDLLGVLRLQAKDLTEAIARFDAAVLLVPDHPGYRFNRGLGLRRGRTAGGSQGRVPRVLSTQPDSVDCRHNLDVLLKGQ